MSKQNDGDPQDTHGASSGEVVRAFHRNRNFVEEVLRENERLRYKVIHLQQELARTLQESVPGGGDAESENLRLRRQLEEIKAQFDALNRENEEFRQRFQDVERQNESLVNIYVSGFQLHSTLDEETVVMIVREILLNLIGAEVFAVWLLNPGTGCMELVNVTDEGGELGGTNPRLGPEVLAAMRAGEQWLAPAIAGPGDPLCAIPLKVDEQPAGILAIYKLLVQKSGFTPLDQELLGLLAAQSASTMIGARVFSRTGVAAAWDESDDAATVALI